MTGHLRTAALVATLACVACGGGGGGGSAPTSPTPPVDTTPQTTNFSGSVDAYGITSHALTPTRGGSMTVTLTWTPTADLDLYVTAAACAGYPPDACVLLARASAITGQREEVSLTVTAGTALRLWVDNFHPQSAVPYALVAVVR